MIEDFYKIDNEESLTKEYPKCPYCHEKLRLRARKHLIVKALLFFLPLKRYKCTNCRKSVYKLG